MNHLWENFIFYVLKRNIRNVDFSVSIESQIIRPFYRHPGNYDIRLKPDIVVKINPGMPDEEIFVLDTKWKYRTDTSISDVRQMYAYNHYFQAEYAMLLYPERLLDNSIYLKIGNFYKPGTNNQMSDQRCGLLFIDLLKENKLNLNLGKVILDACLIVAANEQYC